MLAVNRIKEVAALQKQQLHLLKEYLYAKQYEEMKQKFPRFWILVNGMLLTHELKPVPFVDSIGEIRAYLRLRRVKMSHVLDMDGRMKEIFIHRHRGKRNF